MFAARLDLGRLESLETLPEHPLGVPHPGAIFAGHEGHGPTGGAGATGPPDPVRVGLRRARHVVVDDIVDPCDVDAARGDVRRDQHVVLPLAEPAHRALALALGHVALERDGAASLAIELLRQALGPVLRAREDDRGLAVVAGEEMVEQPRLLRRPGLEETVLDRLCRRARSELDDVRVVEQVVRELADRPRHRRREEQVLPIVGQLLQDPPEVGQEAHVEHVVGFVEHEGVDTT